MGGANNLIALPVCLFSCTQLSICQQEIFWHVRTLASVNNIINHTFSCLKDRKGLFWGSIRKGAIVFWWVKQQKNGQKIAKFSHRFPSQRTENGIHNYAYKFSSSGTENSELLQLISVLRDGK